MFLCCCQFLLIDISFGFDWGRHEAEVIYCRDGQNCWLEKWIWMVKDGIDGIETKVPASVYIQRIIVYLMTFITIIAVIYIIYAGFRILIGAGDDEAQTNAKKIIISVFLWIALMWLSYVIVDFMMWVLSSGSPTTN